MNVVRTIILVGALSAGARLQFAICNNSFSLPLATRTGDSRPRLAYDAPLLVADADAAVKSGRKSLDHWFRYPWYDSLSDEVHRIDVPPPRAQAASWDPGIWEDLLIWIVWIALGLLLGFVVYLLARVYLHRRGRAADGTTPVRNKADADRIESLPFPVRTGQWDLLEEARGQYHQDDFAQAIVYLFSYQLVQLDKQQRIRLARGKTNRQYLREIGAPTPLGRLLEQTMVAFEEVFFGNRVLDRGRFESCWSRLDEFQSLAGIGKT
jgi:hypothetical protein